MVNNTDRNFGLDDTENVHISIKILKLTRCVSKNKRLLVIISAYVDGFSKFMF